MVSRFGWAVALAAIGGPALAQFGGPPANNFSFQFGGRPGQPGFAFNVGGRPGQPPTLGLSFPGQGGQPGPSFNFGGPAGNGTSTRPLPNGMFEKTTSVNGKQFKSIVPGSQNAANNPTFPTGPRPGTTFSPGLQNAANNPLNGFVNPFSGFPSTPTNGFPRPQPVPDRVVYRPSPSPPPPAAAPPGLPNAIFNPVAPPGINSVDPNPVEPPWKTPAPYRPATTGPTQRVYREKFLKLRNQTGQRLTFYVRYHRTGGGLDRWEQPPDKPLVVVLAAGEERYVTRNGARITADRVRVYAVAANGKRLEKFKSRDLVLGRPADLDSDGRVRYRAARMDTHVYTVAATKS